MAISGAALIGTAAPTATIKAWGAQRVQLDLDNNYITGGYPAIQTFMRAILGRLVTIIDIVQAGPAGTNHLYYDKTNDTLMVYTEGGVQVAGGFNLAAVVNCEVLVIFQ